MNGVEEARAFIRDHRNTYGRDPDTLPSRFLEAVMEAAYTVSCVSSYDEISSGVTFCGIPFGCDYCGRAASGRRTCEGCGAP